MTSAVDMRALAEFAPAPREPAAREPRPARSLRECLSNPDLLAAPAPIIPLIVVEGRVTLLSGREKVGKSTLMGSAIAKASRGYGLLGEPLPSGPISTLWYAIDEPVGDLVRRLRELDADPDRVFISNEPRSIQALMKAMPVDFKMQPQVTNVVIDTLSRVLASSGINPNHSNEVEPFMTRLVDYFHDQPIAATLLYHTGKSGTSYRGTTAFGATVDDVLTLRRKGEPADEDDFDREERNDDGRRLLEQVGRNLNGRIHLTCVNGSYGLHDHGAPSRAKFLVSLLNDGPAQSRTRLVERVGGRRQDGLRVVAELVGDGSISERNGRLALSDQGRTEAHGASGQRDVAGTGRVAGTTRQFPGSQQFPQEGTGTEPASEPPRPIGSQIPHHVSGETGTGHAEATNTAIRLRI